MITNEAPRTLSQPLARVPRWLALGAIAAVILGLLVACGGGSSKGKAGDSGSSSAGPSADASSTTLTAAAVKGALLSGDDFGGDFAEGKFVASSNPLPCGAKGSKSLDKQAKPSLQAGTEIDSESLQAQFNEQIKVYSDAAAGKAASAIATKGLDCAKGSLYATDGTTVSITIDGPQDIASQVDLSDIDSVTEWSVSSDDISGVLVAARFGASLALLTFVSPASTDPASLPDPLEVTVAALTKIINS
jgi:hypothetical protein